MFKSAFAGFAVRWLLDTGGWVAGVTLALLQLYDNLPPGGQQLLARVLAGHWGEITLSAAGGFIVWAVTQVFKLRATIKPQAVNEQGQKVRLDELPKATQTIVNAQTTTVVEKKRPTVLDGLGKLLGKK